jgi:hypothetical protein
MPDPDEKRTDPQQPTPESNPQPLIQPTPIASATTTAGDETKGSAGKDVTLPSAALKTIKDEARAKGRREALDELDEVARAAGFESHADALKKLGEINKRPATQPAPTKPAPTQETTTMPKKDQQPQNGKAADPKAAREAQRLADERTKIRKDWKASERRNRELKRQLDAKEAEKDLIIEMTQVGLQDLDYGMRLLTRELAGKSEEEISKYDRKAFFEKLRADKPYLFAEKVVPATTGTNGTKQDGSKPVAPPAGQQVVQSAESKQIDATKMTKEQYQARLKELGLDPHL